MAEKLVIEVDLEAGTTGLRNIEKVAGQTGEKAGRKFQEGFSESGGKISQALGGIKGQLLGLGATFGAAFAVRGVINTTVEIERLETQLSVLLKSSSAAKDTLADLLRFSSTTPFQIEGLAQATNTLLAFGFESQSVIPRLRALGDVAAGSGVPLQDLAFIFSQVRAEGKLTGERFRQLGERGVVLNDALQSIIGPTKDVREEISKGRISFEQFEAAFNSLSASGGLFEGAIQKQSQTIGGALSNLQDNFTILQKSIGDTFGPSIIAGAQELAKILNNFGEAIVKNGPELTRIFSTLTDALLVTPAKFWTDFFAGDANQNINGLNKEIEQTNEQLRIAQEKLNNSDSSFFGNLLGGADQAKQDIAELNLKLIELEGRRESLLQANAKSIASEENLVRSLKEVAVATQDVAAAENARNQARRDLGQIGLTQQQVAQERFDKDLEALRAAKETEAITEEEYRQRKLVREQQFNDQLRQLQDAEDQRRVDRNQQFLEDQVAAEEQAAESFKNVASGFKASEREFASTSKSIGQSLRQGIGTSSANAFAAFGQSVQQGEATLQGFGQSLLGVFGSTLVQLGSGFILQGIAQSLAGFGSGGPLIAAGAALATFGGVLSSLSAGPTPSTSVPDSGGGGFSGGSLGFDQGFTAPNEDEQVQQGPNINVTIEGNVLDSNESGLRILELINSAFETEGAVFKGAQSV